MTGQSSVVESGREEKLAQIVLLESTEGFLMVIGEVHPQTSSHQSEREIFQLFPETLPHSPHFTGVDSPSHTPSEPPPVTAFYLITATK